MSPAVVVVLVVVGVPLGAFVCGVLWGIVGSVFDEVGRMEPAWPPDDDGVLFDDVDCDVPD